MPVSLSASVSLSPILRVRAAQVDFSCPPKKEVLTSELRIENCIASGDDNNPCACGLQYKTTQQNAKGTYVNSDGACGNSPPKPFDVTSPLLIDGAAQTDWRTCRAAASKCSQMANSPACADGL